VTQCCSTAPEPRAPAEAAEHGPAHPRRRRGPPTNRQVYRYRAYHHSRGTYQGERDVGVLTLLSCYCAPWGGPSRLARRLTTILPMMTWAEAKEPPGSPALRAAPVGAEPCLQRHIPHPGCPQDAQALGDTPRSRPYFTVRISTLPCRRAILTLTSWAWCLMKRSTEASPTRRFLMETSCRNDGRSG
jgi:hypothetical protein